MMLAGWDPAQGGSCGQQPAGGAPCSATHTRWTSQTPAAFAPPARALEGPAQRSREEGGRARRRQKFRGGVLGGPAVGGRPVPWNTICNCLSSNQPRAGASKALRLLGHRTKASGLTVARTMSAPERDTTSLRPPQSPAATPGVPAPLFFLITPPQSHTMAATAVRDQTLNSYSDEGMLNCPTGATF